MTSKSIVDNLVHLGLNEREAKTYYSLLQVPEANASDLHRMSGVPRTKIYEALEKLVASGFCTERIEGRRKFYRAVCPNEVHKTMVDNWESEFNHRKRFAGTVFEELEKLSEINYNSDRSLDFIEVIRSKAQISRRYVTLVDDAESEILSFMRPPYAAVDKNSRKAQEIAELGSIARGVVRKSLYVVDKENWSWIESIQEMLDDAGEDARFIDDLPIKMFVFDRKTSLLALPSVPGLTGSDFTMIVIEDDNFAQTCRILFDIFWAQGVSGDEWMKQHKP